VATAKAPLACAEEDETAIEARARQKAAELESSANGMADLHELLEEPVEESESVSAESESLSPGIGRGIRDFYEGAVVTRRLLTSESGFEVGSGSLEEGQQTICHIKLHHLSPQKPFFAPRQLRGNAFGVIMSAAYARARTGWPSTGPGPGRAGAWR